MKHKTGIVKRKNKGAYELTLPKDMLIGLGWIKDNKRNIDKKETNHIQVVLYPGIISKKHIRIELVEKPEKGIYPKRIVDYRKDNKIQKKAYNKRKKEFLGKVKEAQIKEREKLKPL